MSQEFDHKLYIYDIETFSNVFTMVAYSPRFDEYKEFVVHDIEDGANDINALVDFLNSDLALVGYNNINFDGQILEHILRRKIRTAEEIYSFAQEVIDRQRENRFDLEYNFWDVKLKQLDLMALNHYGIGTAKTTSLKWLGFSMRRKSMADLPFDHTHEVKSLRQVDEILRYNRKDVDDTFAFYLENDQAIELRKGLIGKYGEKRLLNMAEPSIGSFILKEVLQERFGISKAELKKRKTYRKKIVVKDTLADYYNFHNQEFKDVLEYFKSQVIEADESGEIKLKGETLSYTMNFENVTYEYGAGGLHGCIKPGVYTSDEDHTIIDIDAKSFYPFIIWTLGIHPEHLPKEFSDVLKELFEERQTHAKGTVQNYSLKIVLNSIYGLFNNKYSVVYDPQCTVATTVNGQLLLSLLIDRLHKYGQILQANTDGITIRIPRKNLRILRSYCKRFERLTDMILEEVEYDKMVIRDVNNYISVDINGDIKRKGMFETYEDIEGSKNFHKNPSAAIVPHALTKYFVNGVNVEETITKHNNIHDFLYAIKKKSNFEYIGFICENNCVQKFKRHDGRVLRYYVSEEGQSLFKHFNDSRTNFLQAVNKGALIQNLDYVGRPEIVYGNETTKAKRGGYRYGDINYEWYINETIKVINEIEN